MKIAKKHNNKYKIELVILPPRFEINSLKKRIAKTR